MTNIDVEIDAQHRAAQAAEDRAAAVTQRMRAIPGLTTLADKLPRRFGEPPNPWAGGTRNLTVQSLLKRRPDVFRGPRAPPNGCTTRSQDR